jgi:cytochrome b561
LSRRSPALASAPPPASGAPPARGTRERLGALGRLPELVYALAAIVAVTALYGVAYSQASAFPAASSLVGHGIGIAGFVLMLMTATLYSLRKLRADARWGSTAAWLRFHMVTGLVGPYMVLLHTAMRFNGLAGLAMLLTVVVVASGLVGRYLYTRVPRTPDGAVIAAGDAGREARVGLLKRRKRLATWHTFHVPLTWMLFIAAFIHVVAALYYATLQR